MQRPNKYSIKISIQSKRSDHSSCLSLQRPSWSSRNHSLSKKHSLVEVMSLQSGRKSDFYERVLEQCGHQNPHHHHHHGQRQSLGAFLECGGNYNYLAHADHFEVPGEIKATKSNQSQIVINHACTCYLQCSWEICPCFQAKDQPCLKDYCCATCIQKKQQLFRQRKQRQDQSRGVEQVSQVPLIFCTCKKTKCKKKYCSCFAAGVMCGPHCSCQGCTNCLMPQEAMDIQQEQDDIPQQQLARMMMPESMDFQPVQFRLSNN